MNIKYFEDIKSELTKYIFKGDTVYVCGDLTQVLNIAKKKYELDFRREKDDFFNCLTDTVNNIVGEEGTILFPSYTWDFCKGKCFSILDSSSNVGIWNNWIIKNRKDFKRTKHPIYSFMVKGKDAELLRMMDNQQSFGKDSPFYYLHQKHAKQLFFNLSIYRGFTFLHYVEQCLEVPYRYHKYWIGDYIDENSCLSKRCYSMYVRDMKISSEECITDDFFINRKLANVGYVDGIRISIINDLNVTFERIKEDFLQGAYNCYKFVNYELDFSKEKTHRDEVVYSAGGNNDGDNIFYIK